MHRRITCQTRMYTEVCHVTPGESRVLFMHQLLLLLLFFLPCKAASGLLMLSVTLR